MSFLNLQCLKYALCRLKVLINYEAVMAFISLNNLDTHRVSAGGTTSQVHSVQRWSRFYTSFPDLLVDLPTCTKASLVQKNSRLSTLAIERLHSPYTLVVLAVLTLTPMRSDKMTTSVTYF